jgi:hypothetical protein
MFFMGGMTLGYLHPPVRAKRADSNVALTDEDSFGSQRLPPLALSAESALERSLLWARRILC